MVRKDINPPTPAPASGIQNIKAHMLIDSEPDLPPVSIALDSNESVLGASPLAIQAGQAAAINMNRYNGSARAILAPAIAERFGLDVNRIAIGPGSDELLARLARAYLGPGDELIRSANGYLKVPNYAFANNAIPISAPDHAFTASVDAILKCVTDQTRVVYLANPDNPSSTYLADAEVRRLHKALPSDVMLVLDCAYEEYVSSPEYQSSHLLVEEFDNVVITRTFSKIFGLAGARVGWLYAPESVVDTITRIGLTFPLSSPSVAACAAALKDTQHFTRVRTINERMRSELSSGLEQLGLKVYASQTNFLLTEFTQSSMPDQVSIAAQACSYLRRRGIAIRRFASPAYNDCARITVGTRSEQQAVLSGLDHFLSGGCR